MKPDFYLLEYECAFTGAMLSYVFWQHGPCSAVLCVHEIFMQVLRLCLESYWVLLHILSTWAPTRVFISPLKSEGSVLA